MKELDCRGQECPLPVVNTRKALKDEKDLLVLVDNEIAANNVRKLAQKLNCQVKLVDEGEVYKLRISKSKNKEEDLNPETGNGKVYFFTSDVLGKGEDKLGSFLIKGFIRTLLEVKPRPEKIIFMNAGVKIPTENKEAIEELKKLEEKGVTILACGTCLDYYHLKEKLKVGSVSNMYEIVKSINNYNAVVI